MLLLPSGGNYCGRLSGLPGNFILSLIFREMCDSFRAQKVVEFFPFKLKGIGGTVLQIFT